MFPSVEYASSSPVLFAIQSIVTAVFYLAVIWVFARMGDNINKIRKMLEQELKKRQQP